MVSAQRICIAALNSPIAYSGGRYHAWILAEALAAAGAEVTYWTDCVPLVSKDFRDYPLIGKSNSISIPFSPGRRSKSLMSDGSSPTRVTSGYSIAGCNSSRRQRVDAFC